MMSTPSHEPTRSRWGRRWAVLVATATSATVLALPGTPASAQATGPAVTSRVSVSSTGAASPSATKMQERVNLDSTGRYAFFSTTAALQSGDTNGFDDVYVRDRIAGTTARVSLTDGDQQITSGFSRLCGSSDDGRFVAFVSAGKNLPGGGLWQVYLRDRKAGTTSMVSVSTSGAPSKLTATDSGVGYIEPCSVSSDGRYLAFVSAGTNLEGAVDANAVADVFRRDRSTGTTARMSVSSGGFRADGDSRYPSMSDDGSVVAFQSAATNLVAADLNGHSDVFVRDPGAGTTVRASLRSNGAEITGGDVRGFALSGSGRYIAFATVAGDVTPDDAEATSDVFVRDLVGSTTTLVSVNTNEVQAAGTSYSPGISDDGRFVTFASAAKNLYVGDTNTVFDQYRRDRADGTTELVSRGPGILAGTGHSIDSAAISDDGTTVAFASDAADLVRNDTNGARDAFVRQFGVELTPFGSVDGFVEQQYVDFEGRAPTGAELAEARTQILQGERTPDGLIDAFAHGATWSGKRAPLVRLYWAYFLRTPDLGGMNYWVGRLKAGKSLASVAKQFSASSEFQSKYGSKTNQQFVTLIYQNIFDRNPDPAGLAYWTGKLDAHTKTRGDVMVNFSESSEGKRVLAPQTDIVVIWLGLMRTMPPPSLFTVAVAAQQAGTPPELFARSVRHDAAYAARVA